MRNESQTISLEKSMRKGTTKVVAVCSGKGGVGKTNIATNIAVALGALNRNVCLLDADVSLANVDVLLGLQPRFNLSHVVSGETDLDTTIIDGPQGVRIVPASSGNFSMTDLPSASQAAIIYAFSELCPQPDVLIVDTAAGISPAVARFAAAAQYALVVVEDEPASLTDAYALIKVFSKHYGISHFQVVTNRSTEAATGRRLFRKLESVTDRYLDVVMRHLGDVPLDRYLVKAVREQRAVVDVYPQSSSALSLSRIARSIDALPAQQSAAGGIQFFFERLLRSESESRGMVA